MFDTDFIIGLLKGNEEARQIYEKYKKEKNLISSFTWYELMIGCCRVKNTKEHLEEIISCLGDTGIMLIDDTIATMSARNTVFLSRKGITIGVVDNFIAASCVINGQTLVTRNIKHFKGIPGLKVEKW